MLRSLIRSWAGKWFTAPRISRSLIGGIPELTLAAHRCTEHVRTQQIVLRLAAADQFCFRALHQHFRWPRPPVVVRALHGSIGSSHPDGEQIAMLYFTKRPIVQE